MTRFYSLFVKMCLISIVAGKVMMLAIFAEKKSKKKDNERCALV